MIGTQARTLDTRHWDIAFADGSSLGASGIECVRVRRRVSRCLALRISCISRLLMLLACLATPLRAARVRHTPVSRQQVPHITRIGVTRLGGHAARQVSRDRIVEGLCARYTHGRSDVVI